MDDAGTNQSCELLNPQSRRPAGHALNEGFKPAPQFGEPGRLRQAAVGHDCLDDRPAGVHRTNRHLQRIILARGRSGGVVLQIREDGVVELLRRAEVPAAERVRQ